MPATPVITVTPGTGFNTVAFANSDTPGSGNRLYRQAAGEYDGEQILIAEGIAVDGSFVDSNVKHGIVYTYRGGAVDSGVEALSVVKTGTARLNTLTLHRVTKISATSNRTGDLIELLPVPTFARGREKSSVVHAMNEATPVVAPALISSNVWRGQCVIPVGLEDVRTALKALANDMLQGCLRDTLGNRLFGALTNLDFSYSFGSVASLEFTGNGYSEVVEI
jgi:hypothetical protein